MVMWQTIPYCLEGWPACWPHSGPCVIMTAICTSLVWLSFFIIRYGCFLFPCVCAPEVPGWMFFPPSDKLRSPLQGTWDTRLPGLFVERVLALAGGGEWDCAWEPEPSQYDDLIVPSVGLLTSGEMADVAQKKLSNELGYLRTDIEVLRLQLSSLLHTNLTNSTTRQLNM
jgi:hypothetical protein